MANDKLIRLEYFIITQFNQGVFNNHVYTCIIFNTKMVELIGAILWLFIRGNITLKFGSNCNNQSARLIGVYKNRMKILSNLIQIK